MPSVEPPELDGDAKRLTGENRERYARYVHDLYTTDGMTTREIARFTGRSYGTVFNLLAEHGTHKRPEGHPLGVGMPRNREGTKETIEILELKETGRYGPIS